MVIISVTYHTKPGLADEFAGILADEHIAEETRREQGNIEYRFSKVIGQQDTLALLEKWESADFLPAHNRQPKFLRLQELKGKYVDSTEVEKFEAEEMK